VRAFFNETNKPTAEEWKAAVEQVRAGNVKLENVPRAPADSEPFVSVRPMQLVFSPSENKLDDAPRLVAA
jgi:hypothetical protein